jgi:hypothetical protein
VPVFDGRPSAVRWFKDQHTACSSAVAKTMSRGRKHRKGLNSIDKGEAIRSHLVVMSVFNNNRPAHNLNFCEPEAL